MPYRGSISSPLRAAAWSSRCLRFVAGLAAVGARLASPWLDGPSAAGITPARIGRLRLGAPDFGSSVRHRPETVEPQGSPNCWQIVRSARGLPDHHTTCSTSSSHDWYHIWWFDPPADLRRAQRVRRARSQMRRTLRPRPSWGFRYGTPMRIAPHPGITQSQSEQALKAVPVTAKVPALMHWNILDPPRRSLTSTDACPVANPFLRFGPTTRNLSQTWMNSPESFLNCARGWQNSSTSAPQSHPVPKG